MCYGEKGSNKERLERLALLLDKAARTNNSVLRTTGQISKIDKDVN